MYISYSDLTYYENFKNTAPTILHSLQSIIGDGTYFISHIDGISFSIIHTLNKANGVPLEEGTRLPLEEAY